MCHLLIKLKCKAYWITKFLNFDLNLASKNKNLQLNELEEWHLLAYENANLYKDGLKDIMTSILGK